MKRYLIIGDGESPHILKWVKELNKHFDVYLFSSRGIHTGIKEIIPGERIHAFNLNIDEAGGNFIFFRLLIPLVRIINKTRPDFVNAHYITSHGFIAALARKMSGHKFPLIITAWGTDIMVSPFKNAFYRSITRFSLKQASLVTTDSKQAEKLVRQFCKTPVSTFPFGLEKLPDTSPGEKDPQLFFSNRTLNANSNIDRVIHFFDKVHKKDPEAKLVIGNDGPKRSELEELCIELGLDKNVSFTGYLATEEQNRLYRKAMFYFSILSSDALSVSLLEAMAHGCIPVISDLPDNTEWVSDCKNGLILSPTSDPQDLSALREDVKNIFTHNRRMVKAGAIFPDAIEQYAHSLINIVNR